MRELLNIPYGLIELQSNIVIFYQPPKQIYYSQYTNAYFQILQYDDSENIFNELSRINIQKYPSHYKFIPFVINEYVNYFIDFLSSYLNDNVSIDIKELNHYIQRISDIFLKNRYFESIAKENNILTEFKYNISTTSAYTPKLTSIYDRLSKFYKERKIKNIYNHYFKVCDKYINFFFNGYDNSLICIRISDKRIGNNSKFKRLSVYCDPYWDYIKNLKNKDKDLYKRIKSLINSEEYMYKLEEMAKGRFACKDKNRYAIKDINAGSIVESINEFYTNCSEYEYQYESFEF